MVDSQSLTRVLRPGVTFVAGRDSATARLLIDTARDLGLSTKEVRTVSDGYLVPSEVADHIFNGAAGKPAEPPKKPARKTRKTKPVTTPEETTP